MGLFIRKSFKAGPIRFNLSKSGVGASVGVKGARVGAGPRGAYVAGGRGGLYFRENIGGKTSSRRGSISRASAVPDGAGSGWVEDEFVDTGAAFPAQVRPSEIQPISIPEVPGPNSPVVYLAIGALFLFYALLNIRDVPWVSSAVSAIFLVIGFSISTASAKLKKAISSSEAVLGMLSRHYRDGKAPVLSEFPREIQAAPKAVQKNFSLRAGRIFIAIFLADRIDGETLRARLSMLELAEDEIVSLKHQIFVDHFNQCVEDMVLDENEESDLMSIIQRLEIPQTLIRGELETIRYLSSIRQQSEAPLCAIDADLSLPKGEECYFTTAARILKEKILRTRTQGGVKIKTRGHEAECEGTAYLTNKRVLVVANGTKSYPINKILDHVLNLESNILEITVDGRKTPLLLSMPAIAPFAAKLEMVHQQFHPVDAD